MRIGSRLIERYIMGAVLPYLLLSLLLLTAILFAQQAGRFGDLLMGVRVPPGMVADLSLSLLPSVLVFTLPMGLLTGILIGFSRMGSDSELVAMRSAGVGTLQMLWPLLLIGLLLTSVSLYVNMEMAPDAVRSLRQVGTRAALYKLDSPVEPRSFSVIGSQDSDSGESPVYVIYVRDGDQQRGQWGRVFLHTEMKDGSVRIVTARSGRIDSGGEQSELVLSDVALTTLPGVAAWGDGEYATERLDQWRIVLDTGRKKLLDSLKHDESETRLNEMGWSALSAYAASKSGLEGREASTMLHKRLALSLSPLLFAFFGAALGMRVRKGGRGIGMLLSVLALLIYYLIMLAGEQLARAGTVAPFLGGWLASFVTLVCGLVLMVAGRGNILRRARENWRRKRTESLKGRPQRPSLGNVKVRLLSFPSLMDVDVLRKIIGSFTVAFVSLIATFQVFTLFDLWRFIIAKGVRLGTVGEYLLFLLPLVSVQLLPASVLIAMLATYALIARRNEAVAWWSGGQSVYRLMLPGLIFAVGVAACLWAVQERLMPQANIRQDILRAQIRGGGSRATVGLDRQWLASAETERLYSYEYEESGALKNPIVYDFDPEGVHLRKIMTGLSAHWLGSDGRAEIQDAVSLNLQGAEEGWEKRDRERLDAAESPDVFKPTADKPSHLSAEALSDYIKTTRRRNGNTMAFEVALQKKYTGPFGVIVMALIGMPLALSFGRRSAIIALCLAVALGLVFWAATGGFQQMGEYGLLPPIVAVWSPVLIFAAAGLYLLFRTRT
ncbi:MAG: lipopolysaccharide export system permease protein lptG [Acidobacteriota bacterium]|nr:lipopolysaccharide export system permease protein lptG [Acidobacteriota bacterium]